MLIHSSAITLSEVKPRDITATQDFVMGARAQMFPMLDPTTIPPDLANFANTYLKPGNGRFLIARSAGAIIGAIGYLPYDHRFAQLDYRGCRVVEVVRLFVNPEHRRCGLAAQLYLAIKDLAAEDQVEMLYLHTHPFLPGAIKFWHTQGFETIDIEDDPIWQTTHMHYRLS